MGTHIYDLQNCCLRKNPEPGLRKAALLSVVVVLLFGGPPPSSQINHTRRLILAYEYPAWLVSYQLFLI